MDTGCTAEGVGVEQGGDRGWVTPYNGLYREAPPQKGTYIRFQVSEEVGILLVEVYELKGWEICRVYL